MRRTVCLMLLTLTLSACNQRGAADARLADADAQDRARQEKAAKDMVAQTEDQVRMKMLEQRVAALEAQVAAMQGDRKLLDAQLVEQRLNQIEAERVDREAGGNAQAGAGTQAAPKPPKPAATPSARKPLVLDL